MSENAMRKYCYNMEHKHISIETRLPASEVLGVPDSAGASIYVFASSHPNFSQRL